MLKVITTATSAGKVLVKGGRGGSGIISSKAEKITTPVWTRSFHSASANRFRRVLSRRSNQPTSLLLALKTLVKKDSGSITRLNLPGNHGGSPRKYRVAKSKMTKPNGVDRPGMLIGVENGNAQITTIRAEALAPSVSSTVPREAGSVL